MNDNIVVQDGMKHMSNLTTLIEQQAGRGGIVLITTLDNPKITFNNISQCVSMQMHTRCAAKVRCLLVNDVDSLAFDVSDELTVIVTSHVSRDGSTAMPMFLPLSTAFLCMHWLMETPDNEFVWVRTSAARVGKRITLLDLSKYITDKTE